MASKQALFAVFNDPHGAKNVSHSMQDSDLVSKVPHQTVTTSATHGGSVSPEFKVPESSPPSHATVNGLQAAKQHKSQGISATASFNGSLLNKYHHAHRVSDSPAQGATAVSNFEDGEVYASTPVAAMPDSPARLTWADQASSGEFIPKEALDLEEEYGGFSVNSEFLFSQDNHFPEVSINGGYNTGGSETGECHIRSRLVTGKKPYSVVQPQQSRFPAIRRVTVQPPATTIAIQPHTQSADHIDCTVTVTSKFNMLASSSSVGNTVPSQHEGLISPFAGVACSSIIIGYSDTAHPPTPNVVIQAQAPSNPCNCMALGPPGQHVPPTNPTVHSNFQPGPHDPIQAASTHSDNALRDAGDHTNPIAITTNSAIEQQIVHPEFQRINPMVTGTTNGGHSLKCPEIEEPDSLHPLADIDGKND
ncbi:hypothetical protein F0562_017710 [Nyssa sinensis]|uniref:Uncharacterized protein n=1 Tax=Nyssa sinensis TaxID=561372 RepID=A0A5J4ZJI0_9ASTE|nr:hypothetical protein F0562_017710 [Nyssa sinensis]